MEFVESWMTQSRTSPAKTTNRWLDPSADPIALDAVVKTGILRGEALARALKEKEEKDAALLSQVEAGLTTLDPDGGGGSTDCTNTGCDDAAFIDDIVFPSVESQGNSIVGDVNGDETVNVLSA